MFIAVALGTMPAAAGWHDDAIYTVKPKTTQARPNSVRIREVPRVMQPAPRVTQPAIRATRPAQPAARKKVVRPPLDERFQPQLVEYSGYSPGTIVIDTANRFLYLVEEEGKARRYGVAVGAEGLQFKGRATIGSKRKWPSWVPTENMIRRAPEKYARYRNGMKGGPDNPLGARALYLYRGNADTHIRIHGTNQPWTIGTAASNGCFRMVNDHVIDLFDRVKIGTEVVVL